MKSSLLKIVGGLVIAIACVAIAKGQICGPSVTKFYVTTSDGEPVKGAVLSFANPKIDLDKIFGASRDFYKGAYRLVFANSKPSGPQRVIVKANGFESVEIPVKIAEASGQTFRVQLRRTGTDEDVVVEQVHAVWGTVRDNRATALTGVRVTFRDGNRPNVFAVTDENGDYLAEIPAGKYTIEFDAGDAGSIAAPDFAVTDRRTNHLAAILDPALVSDAAVSCTPHKFLANEFDCVVMRKNL